MTDDEGGAPEDKRRHVRRLVIMGAVLMYDNQKITLPCRVRDISESGAKLEFEQQQLLPHTFDLKIRDLPPLRCVLRWAKGNRAGVEFVSEEE